MLVVSDTSVVSTLALEDWLGWLKVRWGEVIVPAAVWEELSAG